MPLKGLSIGTVVSAGREPDGLSSQIVIVPTILKILPKALAHDKPVVSIYRHVAAIEEFVDIGAKEQAVANFMLAAGAVRADVRSIEDRQRALARDCAAPPVAVSDSNPERALTKAWSHEPWIAVSRDFGKRSRRSDRRGSQSISNGVP